MLVLLDMSGDKLMKNVEKSVIVAFLVDTGLGDIYLHLDNFQNSRWRQRI